MKDTDISPTSKRGVFQKANCVAFYIFCISLPFGGYVIETGIINLSVTDVILLAVTSLTMICLLLNSKLGLRRVQLKFIIFLVFLCNWITFKAVIFNSDRIQLVVTMIGSLLTFGVVTIFIDSRERLYRALLSVIIGVSAFSAIGIAAGLQLIEPVAKTAQPTTLFGATLPFIRTTGGPLAFGTYGVLLTVSLSTSLMYVISSKSSIRKWIMAVLFGLCFLGFIVVQSRSTFLAIFVSFIILGFSLNDRLPTTTNLKINLFAKISIVAGIAFLSYALFSARLGTVLKRLNQFTVGTNQILQNPLFGTTRDVVLSSTGGNTIHNSFLSIGALYGLPGLFLIILLWVYSVRVSIQSYIHSNGTVLSTILLSIIMGVTIEHMFYSGTFSKEIWFVFAVVISGGTINLNDSFPMNG